MAISGLLLAAGESTRMGTLKALLEWEGTTLLQYQIKQLRAARLGEVVVVLGHEAERLRELLETPYPNSLPDGEGAACRAGAYSQTGEGRGQMMPPPRSSGDDITPPTDASEVVPPIRHRKGDGELGSPSPQPSPPGRGSPSHPAGGSTSSPLPLGEVGGSTSSPLPLGEAGRSRVRVVHNPDYRAGKTSSIRVGIASLSAESTGVLVLGVDQPRPREVLDYLIERHAGALLSLPVQAGRRGHPPIFARALFPELLALSEEREGLREVLQAHVAQINAIPVDSPVVHLNLNRPEDYAAARL